MQLVLALTDCRRACCSVPGRRVNVSNPTGIVIQMTWNLASPSRKSAEIWNTRAIRMIFSSPSLSVLPLMKRRRERSDTPIRVASSACVTFRNFIKSCMRLRILPGGGDIHFRCSFTIALCTIYGIHSTVVTFGTFHPEFCHRCFSIQSIHWCFLLARTWQLSWEK